MTICSDIFGIMYLSHLGSCTWSWWGLNFVWSCVCLGLCVPCISIPQDTVEVHLTFLGLYVTLFNPVCLPSGHGGGAPGLPGSVRAAV